MYKSDKNIDDIFRERLEGYTEAPPPTAWNTLQNNLGSIKPGISHFPLRWINYLVVSSAVVGVTIFAAKKLLTKPTAEKTSINNSIVINPKTEQKSELVTNQSINAENKKIQAEINNKAEQQIAEITGAANNNEHSNYKGVKTESNITTKHSNTILEKNNGTLNRSAQQKTSKVQTKNLKQVGNIPDALTNTELESKTHSEINLKTDNNENLATQSTISEANSGKQSSETNIAEVRNLNNSASFEQANVKEDNVATKQNGIDNNAGLSTPLKTFRANEELQPQTTKIDSTYNKLDYKIPTTVSKQRSKLFEIGVKSGYETGNSISASKNFLLSPYLQLNLSNKFSFLIQPGVKVNNINTVRLQGIQSFYKVNNDGHFAIYDSILIVPDTTSGISFYEKTYKYSQTHDSIVKSYSIGGTYVSFELPILMKYKLFKNFSLLGGVNIAFNTLVNVNENTYIGNSILRTGFDSTFAPPGHYVAPRPIDKIITYDGNLITNYNGPLYSSPNGTLITVGYMFGISYEFWDRYLLDVMVQQSNAKQNVVGGYDINSSFSSLYWRFTLGCKLW